MIVIIIISLILILLYITYNCHNQKIEGAAFLLDPLFIPDNPIGLNESEYRRFIRTLGVKRHLKLDRIGKIESVWYKPPKPELGEKKCINIDCPPVVNDDICWYCH